MENLTIVFLAALCLIAGIVGGFWLDNPVVPDCPECQVCQVCPAPITCAEPVVCEEVPDYVGVALDDFLTELEDNDDLICDKYEYDMDEVSVSKIYDKYSLTFDEEDYTVDFKVKLKFDEDDERSCRETYDVSVFYEEDEDPEVEY